MRLIHLIHAYLGVTDTLFPSGLKSPALSGCKRVHQTGTPGTPLSVSGPSQLRRAKELPRLESAFSGCQCCPGCLPPRRVTTQGLLADESVDYRCSLYQQQPNPESIT